MDMKKVGPYEAVTHDFVRDDGYRILLSGAYNAMGLVGTEYNGITVLDERSKSVVTDCIGRQASGWYYGQDGGPGERVTNLFEALKHASPEDFTAQVNELGSARARKHVEDRTKDVVTDMTKTIKKTGLNTAFDAISDALHEMADREGIPEGDERDAWRLRMLESADIAPQSDVETLAAALVKFGVTRAQIEQGYVPQDPTASDDEPAGPES